MHVARLIARMVQTSSGLDSVLNQAKSATDAINGLVLLGKSIFVVVSKAKNISTN